MFSRILVVGVRPDKYINIKEYINILEKGLRQTIYKLFSTVNRVAIILQGDNEPPHTAKLTKSDFLKTYYK